MPRFDPRIAYLLFVASGATGLVYEVTWFRDLSLVFGASFSSSSLVLAAFMAGMSLGGFVFGRLAERFVRPLRVYGFLEIGIGLVALGLPTLIRGIDALYIALAPGDGRVDGALLALRGGLAFAALAAPTFLMGATLPVVTRLLVSADEEFGVRLARLYGANTVGAVLGTLLAGFVMIPALGVSRTQWVAVVVNLAIGVLALFLDRGLDALPAASAKMGASDASERNEAHQAAMASEAVARETAGPALPLVFWGTTLSGLASFALEVLWTRALSVAVGSSTYSFSVMLAAFLSGIALGSLVHALRPTAGRPLAPRFALVLVLAGGFSLMTSQLIPSLPQWAIELNLSLYGDLSRIRPLTTFVLAFVLMLVPCLFMGMAFPLANEARVRLAAAAAYARPVGDTLAANTLGSIAGSLGAGFVLIPWVGLERAMALAACLYVVFGAIVWMAALHGSGRRQVPQWGMAIGLAVLAAALPLLLPERTDDLYGAFSNNQLVQYVLPEGGVDVDTALSKGVVRYYREGRSATVSVLEQDGFRSLSVNGKIVASDDPEDLRTQYMLAHVPLLMHPEPKSALVIGMGAGTTLGGIAAHDDLERLGLAEIEPAMLGAEPHFAAANGAPLSDPRLSVFVEDGRNYLKTTDHRYDVITADPIHPWTRGSGYLYTEEYYRLAAARLEPGGIMCQWLPVADLSPADFKSVVATFAKVYPHVQLWHSTSAILIGSEAPLEVDFEGLARRSSQPRVAAQLRRLGLERPAAFLAELQLDDAQVRDFAEGARVNTDDNLHLEFSSPLAIGADRQVWGVLRELHGYPPGVSPLAPESRAAKARAVRVWQQAKTGTVLGTIGLRSPNTRARRQGLARLERIVEVEPDYRPAAMALAAYLAQRAEYLLDEGARSRAAGVADAERAVRLDAESPGAQHAIGRARASQGRDEEALAAFERAQALEPRHWRHALAMADVLERMGRRDAARAALDVGLEIHPTHPLLERRAAAWASPLSGRTGD